MHILIAAKIQFVIGKDCGATGAVGEDVMAFV
jgi:hypothetical protein